MFSRIFIERPKLALVISILILIVGGLSIPLLPIESKELEGLVKQAELVGAKVETVEGIGWVEHGELVRQRGKELEAQGRHVHVGRCGDESGLGEYACAYAQAFVELVEQAEALDLTVDEIWVSSSDATQAGLVIAAKHVETFGASDKGVVCHAGSPVVTFRAPLVRSCRSYSCPLYSHRHSWQKKLLSMLR